MNDCKDLPEYEILDTICTWNISLVDRLMDRLKDRLMDRLYYPVLGVQADSW